MASWKAKTQRSWVSRGVAAFFLVAACDGKERSPPPDGGTGGAAGSGGSTASGTGGAGETGGTNTGTGSWEGNVCDSISGRVVFSSLPSTSYTFIRCKAECAGVECVQSSQGTCPILEGDPCGQLDASTPPDSGTGGAPPGTGGAAAGGALASGATGGVRGPDAAACKYEIPAVEGDLNCSGSVCRSAQGYEIRLSSPEGFYVGHLVWVLVTCNTQFYQSTYPTGALTTLGFPLTADEFETLPDPLPLGVYYGSPGAQVTGARLVNCGTVSLSDPPACTR